ncbi:MAG: M43 family zinc metalloprotease, partial [Methylococcales bacterium]
MTTAAIDIDTLNNLFDNQKKLDDIFNSMFDNDDTLIDSSVSHKARTVELNAQVYDGIQQMNDDFSMTNSDNGNTIAAFQGIIGNADIQFKLATKDPNGNCHSGITRTYSNTTYDSGLSFANGNHPIVDAVSTQHGIWQQQKYLNIFVCIDPNGAAGYTLKPSTFIPATSMYGGILVRHDYFGTIGTSSLGRRHTLSHEAGHWLNLSHCWGNTNEPGLATNCSSDDGIGDT